MCYRNRSCLLSAAMPSLRFAKSAFLQPTYLYSHSPCFALLFLLCLACFSAASSGCTRVASEQLHPIYPDQYALAVPAQQAWQALDRHVKSLPDAEILAHMPEERLISWSEPIKRVKKGRGLSAAEYEELGPTAVAVTTASLHPKLGGSFIRCRRVYYGPYTQPEVAYSRGEYERNLHQALEKQLGLNTGS